jgi:hypothetical protein
MIKNWIKKHTSTHLSRLASLAGTTVGSLYVYSQTGRGMSAKMAGHLEQASATLAQETCGGTDVLRRGDLSPTCKSCMYYRAIIAKGDQNA